MCAEGLNRVDGAKNVECVSAVKQNAKAMIYYRGCETDVDLMWFKYDFLDAQLRLFHFKIGLNNAVLWSHDVLPHPF